MGIVGAGLRGGKLAKAAWAIVAGLLIHVQAFAAGTPAGTLIGNTATLTYSTPTQPGETATASSSPIVVAKLLNVVVTWQDAAAVTARSPDTARPLTFVVTNTGNAPEAYRLARADNLGADQFDTQPAAGTSLWLESGAQAGFQASGPNADTAYIAGANDPLLPADGSRTVYVLSDIPAGVPTAASGRTSLAATATTPGAAGAAPGTLLGMAGAMQIVAGSATQSTAIGSYIVSGVSVGVAKTVTSVRDPQGGTRVQSGSVLTYRIVLTLTGSGAADGIAVNDPLPSPLTYVPGSLTVDGSPRTDAADADGASAANNTISAAFGSLTAPAERVIEFRATVN